MKKKPEITGVDPVATSRFFEIENVHLRFSNGEERIFERLKTRQHGAVMIIPMLDDETILLINEYAVGLDRYVLGFPKGLLEANEDLLEAANRELMEEVGYAARQMTYLTTMTAMPGYTNNSMKVVLAQDLYPAKLAGDEPEALEVVSWKLNQIDLLLQREDFSEARSIAAVFLAREIMHAKQSKGTA